MLVLALTLSAHADWGCPAGYTCVDPKSIRINAGLSHWCLGGGKGADRCAQGLTVGYGTGLLSVLFGRNEGLAAHDDLWLDLTLGRMSSEPLRFYDDPEGRFGVMMDVGYAAMVGVNLDKFGVFGGVGIRYAMGFTGNSSAFEGARPTFPIHARGQVRVGKRLYKAVAWSTFTLGTRGLRVDVPLSEVVWVSAMAQHTNPTVDLWSDPMGQPSGRGLDHVQLSIRVSYMD